MEIIPNLKLHFHRIHIMLAVTIFAIVPNSKLCAGIGDIDANGWTELSTSPDSRMVYVSSSTGDDSNDGLTPETSLNTINAANSLVRDGYPDWIVLKRGDTFEQPVLYRWKSGRNAAEPMVISYYGDEGPRPLIKLTGKFIDWDGAARSNIALVGLDFYRSISDPDSVDFNNSGCDTALRLVSLSVPARNVLVEDCNFRYCWIVVQGGGASSFISNFNLRRNNISYAWTHGSRDSHDNRIQGIYITNTSNITMEENIFHHNGWSDVIADADANQYNHNVYMSNGNQPPILLRGNILSYGAAHGIQLRSGGTAELNAFIGNAISMNLGYSSLPIYNFGNTYANDNVVTNGRPQIPNKASEPQTGAIWGLTKDQINNVFVNDNIVANVEDIQGTNVDPYVGMTPNEYGSGNIAWNWGNEREPATDPGWLDQSSDAQGFATSLGLLSYDEWVEIALEREIGKIPFDLTAYSYVDYVRNGFNKATVVPPFSYELGLGRILGSVPVSGIAMNPKSIVLLLGNTAQFAAFVLPSDAEDKSFSWSSSDPAVVTVDENGLVSTQSEGDAEIIVTSTDGGFTGTSQVQVIDIGTNVALNKPVTFSAIDGTNDKLVDGSRDNNDRWSGQFLPQSAEIDLGMNYQLKSFRLYPYQLRDYRYTIEVADAGSTNFQLVVNRTANTEGGEVLIDNVSIVGGKVRLTVVGAATYSGSYASINELEVYGKSLSAGPADLNNDGVIDQMDTTLIRSLMGLSVGDENYSADADFDADGTITRKDYNIWYRMARASM